MLAKVTDLPSQDSQPRILCDFWYLSELPLACDGLDAQSAVSQRFSLKERVRRAMALAGRARDYDVVVPNWFEYGLIFIVLAALRGLRNVVLLEFIDNRLQRRSWLLRTGYGLAARLVIGPAMRRSVRGMQVMTDLEGDAVAARYGVERGRINVVRWPLWGTQRSTVPVDQDRQATPYVFSSGRAACDWETLFAAAQGADWRLVVVCSGADAPRVAALNGDGRAQVLVDIPLDEHDRLLAGAAVCAIVLFEERKSSGQIRLGSCIELGVPAVVSDIAGLKGYLQDGITGTAVKPGDAAALRSAIDRLMRDGAARQAQVEAARNTVNHYGRVDYFAELASMLRISAGFP